MENPNEIMDFGTNEENRSTEDTLEQASTPSIQPLSAIAPMSLSTDTYQDPKAYLDAPFTVNNGSEAVTLNNGALRHTVTDFVLPGRGGFDLAITRRYDSTQSNTQDMTPGYTDKTVNYHLYGIRAQNLKVLCPLVQSPTDASGTHTIHNLYVYKSNRYESSSSSVYNLLDRYEEEFGAGSNKRYGTTRRNYIEYYYKNYLYQLSDITVKKEGVFSVVSMDSTSEVVTTLTTTTRPNDHFRKLYGLGYGWSFALPSIETVAEEYQKDRLKYHTFLHLEDGRSLKVLIFSKNEGKGEETKRDKRDKVK